MKNVSNAEITKRLRNLEQPIKLFGESEGERRIRLRTIELKEERTEVYINSD